MRSSATAGLVVGVDTHRDTHTAALCDRAGQAMAVRQVRAGPDGYAAALAWARQEAGEAGLAWAIEGTRHYGLGLALPLVRRFEEAISALQDAAAIFRETGDRHSEGITLNNVESVRAAQSRRERQTIRHSHRRL